MIEYACALCFLISLTTAQNVAPVENLHVGLSENIGNFSLELLFHTSYAQRSQPANLVLSPLTVWTILAVVAEGATNTTQQQIRKAARLGHFPNVREQYKKISKYLVANTSTVDLTHMNCIFINESLSLERDFQEVINKSYGTPVIQVNFSEKEKTAKYLNKLISDFTKNRIRDVFDPSTFDNTKLVLVSALYFKGKWKAPFNASMTIQRPFYDSNNQRVLGTVNMMYNHYAYPFANIRKLEARIIELPYGSQGRLSMFIMLPNPNVTLDRLFKNLGDMTFDYLYEQMRISAEEYADEEVDCYIPRFKIESKLDLVAPLQYMKIIDLFRPGAHLEEMARLPLYVSKVIHKAEIEVTEEGTTASAVTAAEFGNRIGNVRFEANRPFAYIIVEKTTNVISFGGIYQQPSLY